MRLYLYNQKLEIGDKDIITTTTAIYSKYHDGQVMSNSDTLINQLFYAFKNTNLDPIIPV